MKVLLCVQRKSGLSHEQFRARYESVRAEALA